MYRTLPELSKRRDWNDDELISIYEINQSARAVMKLLGVRIFNCGSLPPRVIGLHWLTLSRFVRV